MRITSSRLFLLILTLALALPLIFGCTADDDDDDDDDVQDDDDDTVDDDDDDLPEACDEIYAADLLPTFEIEISATEWAGLQDEWANWADRMDQGLDLRPYHALTSFKYGDETVTDAAIRLKGSQYNWDNSPNKMQFVISFNENDHDGRWHGLRKLGLDAPHNDMSMLHDRLASWFYQELGVPAACANSARLNVNGEYYGLFTNIENMDREFLERWFGKDNADGNMYQEGEKQTNESDPDISDWETFDSELTLDELEQLMDIEAALQEWVAEALIPQVDGYWAGGTNWFLYNHPEDGYTLIPWDNDYSFEIEGLDIDPLSFEAPWGFGKPQHILTVLADSAYYLRYLELVDASLAVYDPSVMQGLIAAWSAQIFDAMSADNNKPYTIDNHSDAVDALSAYVAQRQAYGYNWLNCKNGAGQFDEYEYGGKTYGLWHTACSWENAEAYCDYLGGHLAVPLNSGEQAYLAGLVFTQVASDWWMGANDLDEDAVWTDPDGTVLSYTNWASGHPTGDLGMICSKLDDATAGQWKSEYCELSYPSVCVLP